MTTPLNPPTPGAADAGVQDALPPGTRFFELEVLRVLGVGGFGIVYLARDHALERDVALKEYMPAALASRAAGSSQVSVRSGSLAETYAVGLRSFVNEAKLLARFDHPSLVKVYRFWEANGTAYMVMPYLQGRTLREARRGMSAPPDEGWIRGVLDPVLDALERLHREEVFHRDIAPDNILLPEEGPPVLLDFGAARQVISGRTQSLTAILKPSYAPIEQYAEITQLRQGPWTDIYALGAVMHYLLFGAPPSPATARAVYDDLGDLAQRVVPGVSPRLLATVAWALAVRPQARPQDVATLRAALDGRVAIPEPARTDVTVPPTVGPGATAATAPTLVVPLASNASNAATSSNAAPGAQPPYERTVRVETFREPVPSTRAPASRVEAPAPPAEAPIDPAELTVVKVVRTVPPARPVPRSRPEDTPAPAEAAVDIGTTAWPTVAIGAVLLALVAALVWWMFRDPGHPAASDAASAPPLAQAADPAPAVAPPAPPAVAPAAAPAPAAPAPIAVAAAPIAAPTAAPAAVLVATPAAPTEAATAEAGTAEPAAAARPASRPARSKPTPNRPADAAPALPALVPTPESRPAALVPTPAPAETRPAPTHAPAPVPVPAPVQVAEAVPTTARDACGKRVFLALARCMEEQCRNPRYATQRECVRVLEIQRRREGY